MASRRGLPSSFEAPLRCAPQDEGGEVGAWLRDAGSNCRQLGAVNRAGSPHGKVRSRREAKAQHG